MVVRLGAVRIRGHDTGTPSEPASLNSGQSQLRYSRHSAGLQDVLQSCLPSPLARHSTPRFTLRDKKYAEIVLG